MHYETFGWELENTREVYHESEKLLGANIVNSPYIGTRTTFETATEVTNYVTLRFSRDLQMRNYSRLATLQDEFESLDEPQQTNCKVNIHNKPIGWTILSCVAVLAIIILIILTANINSNFKYAMLISMILSPFPIVIMIIKWIGYKKYYTSDLKKILSQQRTYESLVELYEKRRKGILAEAIRLSSSGISHSANKDTVSFRTKK